MASKGVGRKFYELIGQQFGRLTPVHYLDGKWKCSCSCGSSIIVRTDNLRNGHTRSCGCLHKEVVSELGKKLGERWGPIRGKELGKIWGPINFKKLTKKQRIANGKKVGRMYGKIYGKLRFNTLHEQLMKSRLKEWGIKHKHNKVSFPIGHNIGGAYRLDFYLPKFKVDLEIDGNGHDKKSDRRRDKYLLKEYGIRTIRIKNEEVSALTEKRFIRRIERR